MKKMNSKSKTLLSAFWMRFPSLLGTDTVLLDTQIFLKWQPLQRILYLKYSATKKTGIRKTLGPV
jgi:hypothetical protein